MTMLFLMRHSIAVSMDFQTTDDSRCLTEQGRVYAKDAGHALRDFLDTRNLELTCIVTSPLVRTVQTAELVAAALGYEAEIRAMHALRSESPSQRGVDELQALGHGVVLAVTHEPIVSAMSARIVGDVSGGYGAGYHASEVRCFEDNTAVWRHQP